MISNKCGNAKDKRENYFNSERQEILPQMKDELRRTKHHSLGYRSNMFNQGFRSIQTPSKHLSLCLLQLIPHKKVIS